MASLSHNIEYACALFGVKLVRAMSPRMADRFGRGLGSLVHSLLTSRKRIARENLRLGMGDTLSESEIQITTKKVFRNIGQTLVEFARFGVTTIDDVNRLVVSDMPDYVHRVMAEGKGLMVVSAHFGNWELLGTWFAAQGFPMDFLVGVQHNKKVDDLFLQFRRNMGVGIISSKTGLRGVLKALRANHIVGVVADQHFNPGLPVEFFGRKAAFAKGPAAFAVKSGCPVMPILLRRDAYDKHVFLSCPPIYPIESAESETEIERITIEVARYFEEQIRRYPDQWMWTHRRWKL